MKKQVIFGLLLASVLLCISGLTALLVLSIIDCMVQLEQLFGLSLFIYKM